MKHLKKIFEKEKLEFDMEYVKYCLQDFLDNGFKIISEKEYKIDRIQDRINGKEWHKMVEANLPACMINIEKKILIDEKSLIFTYTKSDEEMVGLHSGHNRTITSHQNFINYDGWADKIYELFEMMDQAKSRLKDQEYTIFYSMPGFKTNYEMHNGYAGDKVATISLLINIIRFYS